MLFFYLVRKKKEREMLSSSNQLVFSEADFQPRGYQTPLRKRKRERGEKKKITVYIITRNMFFFYFLREKKEREMLSSSNQLVFSEADFQPRGCQTPLRKRKRERAEKRKITAYISPSTIYFFFSFCAQGEKNKKGKSRSDVMQHCGEVRGPR